ncbi:apolipoprotein N-acyltransferase [soil metagenome]
MKSTPLLFQLAGGVVAGLLFAGILLLAFPPMGIWPLAWVLPLPLLALAVRASRPGRSVLAAGAGAGIGVLPGFAVVHFYMWNVTNLGYPLHTLYMGSWYFMFVTLGALLLRAVRAPCPERLSNWRAIGAALLLATLWTAIEYIRGDVFLDGYAFYFVAHPTIELWTRGPLHNPAHSLGVYFVTFIVVLPACGVACWRFSPAWVRAGVPLAGALLLASGGYRPPPLDPQSPEVKRVRVACIQTNIPQDNKDVWPPAERMRALERWMALTRRAAYSERSGRVDFIAWPETSFPGEVLNVEAVDTQRAEGVSMPMPAGAPEVGLKGGRLPVAFMADRLMATQAALGVPMLVGCVALADLKYVKTEDGHLKSVFTDRYNSVCLLRRGVTEAARYDKMQLTNFGEVIPIAWRFKWLQNKLLALGAEGMTFDLAFGKHKTVFTLPARGIGTGDPPIVRVVTPICFEATFGHVCRGLVFQNGARAADLMVNPSNDGWFWEYPFGRPTNLLVARWRCVELGTPMARAVNTGVSAAIDDRGFVFKAGVDDDELMANAGTAAEDPLHREGIMTATFTLPRAGAPRPLYAVVGNIFPIACVVVSLGACAALLRRRVRRGSDGAGEPAVA